MLSIKILYNDRLLGSARYVVADDQELYLYHFEVSEESVVEPDSIVFMEIYIDNGREQYKLLSEQHRLSQKAFFKKSFCLCLYSEIVEGTDFGLYDQGVIDALYFPDGNVNLMQYIRCQSSYNIACLRFYGISEETISNKNITLDCNDMHTRFMFYTLLAEALMGNRAYIGSNLDAFSDCLKHLTLHNCTINLVNAEKLSTLFSERLLGYLMQDLTKYFKLNML